MFNPLLQAFSTPFETVPFNTIRTSHFKPAIIEAIALNKKEIDTIINNPETPNFANTIEALEYSGQLLDRISSIFFNLNSAETNKEIQKTAREIAPLLSNFNNDIILNKALFTRVQSVFVEKERLSLSVEQNTLLKKIYKNFTRNGANLSDKDQKILRKIDSELAELRLEFSENILADTQAYTLHITKESELEGIPDNAIEQARQRAKNKQKKGWIFTLDYPNYHAVITYCESRKIREKIARAYGKRGFQNNKNNNEAIVLKIVQLRQHRAQLLGYKNHAAFVLEERMAENPIKVLAFLEDLLEKALPVAKEEFSILSNFAKKDGIDKLQIWDGPFYTEKLKKEGFHLDDELLKPYFKLENVIQGVFEIANKLYDLQFKETNRIDTYHSDVTVYEVTDGLGQFIAVFYADFFPRKGKRNGAWMTSYKGQWIKNNYNSRPHISIVCNFTKPTKSKPSLLTFREVTTLFHEFGHALHGMLANTTYPGLSGTNVYWDFVELPSQLLENWAYEEEALSLFAKHYKTGELLPIEFVTKIKESSNFMEGMATIRQLSFGFLDMTWHMNQHKNTSVKEIETQAFSKTQLYPPIPENCMSTAFSHIFSGGYSSGYYSYKWAEVLDADAFELFKSKGVFNRETAEKFKKYILSQGGTQEPMKLYKQFRGAAPDSTALLRRAGLLKNNKNK